MTTLLLGAALNSLAVAVGTFVANFYILWIIGNKAKAAQEEQNRTVLKMQQEALDRFRKEQDRMRKYAELES